MPSSGPLPSLPHLSSSSSCSRLWKGPTSSSTAPATLSSALTEERLRELKRRNRYRGPARAYYGGQASDSARELRGLSPGRESCYATASTAARSFSSSVLLRFQEFGANCFNGRRGRDVGGGCGDGKGKASVGGGGGGAKPRESKAGTRSSPWTRLDVGRSSGKAAAAELDAKPLRERAPAEEASGNPVACGGREPSRVSTSAPPVVIPGPRRDEKPSSRRSGSTEGALGPPPASASRPPLPQGREAHGAVAGPGRWPTTASSASTVTAPGGGGKEGAFVWADRYRPRALADFICNRAVVAELREMVRERECDHFIFEGPPGVGKKTMISALLREVFGPEKSETKDEVKVFELKGEIVPNIQANVKTSPQHVEINLSELRGYERHAVVALIKGSPHSIAKNTMQCDHTNCQAIVVYEADKLSTDSQHYICWLMEKYKACFKIIFCCSDSSKLQPVKQLCKVIKLGPPSQSEIVEVLEYIAKNEGIDLPYNVTKKIVDNAKQNLRQAIRSFEASWKSSHPFKEDQVILTGWEEDIANIAKNIVEEQSPRQLYSIREKLKNLIEHDVSPHFIFSTLQLELKKHLDDDYHTKLDDMCEKYKNDIRLTLDTEKSLVLSQDVQENTGKRNDGMISFMTIEEFTAKFMSFYKSNVVKNVDGKNFCSV